MIERLHLEDEPVAPGDVMNALAGIEQQARQAASELPQYAVDSAIWDGLVFSVSGVRVTAAMNELSEMLPMQQITRVPGAKPWMLGLANVRGSLLPIIDLQAFFGAKAVVPSKSARILVLRLRGLVAGLLVPSVQGMRHFNIADRLPDARMQGPLGAYVFEAFGIDGEIWPVISMHALAADPAFRSAAM